MTEQEQLQQAIRLLDEKRPLLGESVVNTTIAALQERLLAIDAASQNHLDTKTAQRKQVSILFATITGIARRIAESLPNTNMLDVMNGLWRRLDRAITLQGWHY